MPWVPDRVVRLAAGAEVARREGVIDAVPETLVHVEVPGQRIGVVARAGVARHVADRPDRVRAGAAVAETGPQSRVIAHERPGVAVDHLLVETVRLREAVLERAVRGAVGDAELVVDPPAGAAEQPQVAARSAERAPLERARQPGTAVRRPPLREDLDDRADRIRAVERRLRAPHHLDPLDLAGRHAAEVVGPAVGVHAHAVDQHVVVVRFAAAHEDRGYRALPAGRLHAEAGHLLQHVRHRVAAEPLDLVGGEDGMRLGHRRAALGGARRGDDDRVLERRQVELEIESRVAGGDGQVDRGRGKPGEPGRNALGALRRQLQTVAAVHAGRGDGQRPQAATGLDGGAGQHAAGQVRDEAGHDDRWLGSNRRDGRCTQDEHQQGQKRERNAERTMGRRRNAVDHSSSFASPSEAG